MGVWLVRDAAPVHADIAVVLGGDAYGHRILRAADLVKQGFVPFKPPRQGEKVSVPLVNFVEALTGQKP